MRRFAIDRVHRVDRSSSRSTHRSTRPIASRPIDPDDSRSVDRSNRPRGRPSIARANRRRKGSTSTSAPRVPTWAISTRWRPRSVDRSIDRSMVGWMDGNESTRIDATRRDATPIDRLMETNRYRNHHMDGWMDGLLDGGWMDGWKRRESTRIDANRRDATRRESTPIDRWNETNRYRNHHMDG